MTEKQIEALANRIADETGAPCQWGEAYETAIAAIRATIAALGQTPDDRENVAAAPAADTELLPYLRQYRHNDGSDGFVFAYEKEGVDRHVALLRSELVAPVAAATPGADASTLKRYDGYCSYDGGGPAIMEESSDGQYVLFDDLARLWR